MAIEDHKDILVRYLTTSRDALLWKIDGLSEYDARRPLTPTGTNLLGLLKHVGSVGAGYFGECFGKDFPEPLPWFDEGAEDNADMWATAEESREDIVGLYHRCWAHADQTIASLSLDDTGLVPWWGDDRRHPTLHTLLIHMIAENNRHAGQADIVRETIDGAAGLRDGVSNLPEHDEAWWTDYHARVEQAARAAGELAG